MFGIPTDVRNDQCSVIRDKMNSGIDYSKSLFRILDISDNILCEVDLDSTNPFNAPVDGTISLNGVSLTTPILRNGIANKFKFLNKEDPRIAVIDGKPYSVKDDGSGDIQVDDLDFYVGAYIKVDYITYSIGNAV